MVHIVYGPYCLRQTYCGLNYKADMAAITWEKPLDACGLLSILEHVCAKCVDGVSTK